MSIRWVLTATLACVTLVAVAGCADRQPPAAASLPEARGGVTMKLTSPAFTEGAFIPARYTCDGQDISPPLSWSNVPSGTSTLALIADDPDAPAGNWIHWVLFNLPPDLDGLAEAVPVDPRYKGGAIQGVNSWRRSGYGGPCPPRGTHRYFFRLYALDTLLNLDSKAKAADVEAAMQGHILAHAELMGLYKR